MQNQPPPAASPTAKSHEPSLFALWGEVMNQLRQNHDDIWNGVKFFLTINAVALAGVFAFTGNLIQLLGEKPESITSIGCIYLFMIFILSFLGWGLTGKAKFILQKHRRYYLESLLIKTALEREQAEIFGKSQNVKIYNHEVQAVDMVLPWKLEKPGSNPMTELSTEQFFDKFLFPEGSISQQLCHVYDWIELLYIVTLFLSLTSILIIFATVIC